MKKLTFLVLLFGLFLIGDKVILKNEPQQIGTVVLVHLPHGHHTQSHYLINWETGKDSGYSQFLYEFLLIKK